ncbi:hypothetical protein H1X87_11760 [Vibrio parahaemolyticus]|uniref:hypothetical protein n=1 Tax=Vibrio parahaemolyticus TaxID=670 RepID=UPI001655C80A|nr:hypothetical protein [Vibrio parahaemolyticus]ELB2072111.1 hypothetical protein [Vibrio parahaemolyticus]MBC8662050.1 hypothetical protein [Vibrio parahaemolyticus]
MSLPIYTKNNQPRYLRTQYAANMQSVSVKGLEPVAKLSHLKGTTDLFDMRDAFQNPNAKIGAKRVYQDWIRGSERPIDEVKRDVRALAGLMDLPSIDQPQIEMELKRILTKLKHGGG